MKKYILLVLFLISGLAFAKPFSFFNKKTCETVIESDVNPGFLAEIDGVRIGSNPIYTSGDLLRAQKARYERLKAKQKTILVQQATQREQNEAKMMLKKSAENSLVTYRGTERLGATCYPLRHAIIPKTIGMTYHKARKKLLSHGWQPFQTIRWQDKDRELIGHGKTFWEQGYVEVENCYATGMSRCSFLFTDVYGNTLKVTTSGEEYPKAKAFSVVEKTAFVCN